MDLFSKLSRAAAGVKKDEAGIEATQQGRGTWHAGFRLDSLILDSISGDFGIFVLESNNASLVRDPFLSDGLLSGDICGMK